MTKRRRRFVAYLTVFAMLAAAMGFAGPAMAKVMVPPSMAMPDGGATGAVSKLCPGAVPAHMAGGSCFLCGQPNNTAEPVLDPTPPPVFAFAPPEGQRDRTGVLSAPEPAPPKSLLTS